jgi:hypothetical protein
VRPPRLRAAALTRSQTFPAFIIAAVLDVVLCSIIVVRAPRARPPRPHAPQCMLMGRRGSWCAGEARDEGPPTHVFYKEPPPPPPPELLPAAAAGAAAPKPKPAVTLPPSLAEVLGVSQSHTLAAQSAATVRFQPIHAHVAGSLYEAHAV